MWLCVFNQTNKSQSFRFGGGLIKTLPAGGEEEEEELEEEMLREKEGNKIRGTGGS